MATAVAPPRPVQLHAASHWKSGAETLHDVRDFKPFYTDEPPEFGGADAGPNPLEYVLSAYSGCLAVMIHKIADEQSFKFSGLDFEASGELDPRGMEGTPGVRPYFNRVQEKIVLHSREPQERLRQLREQVEARCPMHNLLADTGLKLDVQWSIAP